MPNGDDLSILISARLDTSSKAITNINEQIKLLSTKLQPIKLNVDIDITQLKNIIDNLNKIQNQVIGSGGKSLSIGAANKKEIETFVNTLKKSGTVVNYTYDSLGKLNVVMKQNETEVKNLSYQYNNLSKSFNELNTKTKVPDLLNSTNQLAKQIPEIQKIYEQFNNLKLQSNGGNIDFGTEKLIPDLELLNNKTKILSNGMQQVTQTFKLNSDQTLTVSGQYNMLTKEMTNVSTATGNLINRQTGFISSLENAFRKFPVWIVASTAIMGFIHQVSDGINYIKELDNALNEIRIVTNKTQEEVNNLGNSYNKLAKEMSVTTKELASTSADLYRQGLDDSQVEERMKSIIQYAKISAIGLDESNKIITATANATGENVQKIVDIFALLGRQNCPLVA